MCRVKTFVVPLNKVMSNQPDVVVINKLHNAVVLELEIPSKLKLKRKWPRGEKEIKTLCQCFSGTNGH